MLQDIFEYILLEIFFDFFRNMIEDQKASFF